MEKYNLSFTNIPEFEDDNNSEEIQTYAKAQLGVERNETKILRPTWYKSAETLDVTFPSCPNKGMYPSEVSIVLLPSWFSITSITWWKINLSRSVSAWNKMGSTTTRSNVKEVEQMEQQSTGKDSCPTSV